MCSSDLLDSELIEEFFAALSHSARLTLHITKMAGKNSHHIAEAAFKGFGRAVRMAIFEDSRLNGTIPSTKGVL